jgi:hypothetical protein
VTTARPPLQSLAVVHAAWAWLLGVALALLATASVAQGDTYLAGLPDADRVMREVRGSDVLDTAAHQMAALHTLRMTAETLTDGRVYRRELTPAESARLAQYRQGYMAIQQRMNAGFDAACQGPECERFRFNRLRMGYETSDAFKKSVWEALTDPSWRERHVKDWHTLAAAAPSSLPTPAAATAARPATASPASPAAPSGAHSVVPSRSISR